MSYLVQHAATVQSQIAALPEIEPPPGWEERAIERAKREGVLPTSDAPEVA